MFFLPIMDIECYGDSVSKKVKKEYVYVLKSNKIFKLYMTIDEQILKDSFVEIYNSLIKEVNDCFEIVSKSEVEKLKFPIDMQYVGKMKIGKFKKYDAYKIPSDNVDTTLFYLINNIYNNNMGDAKNINEENLYGLHYEFVCNLDEVCFSSKILMEVSKKVIDNIISNINIEIIDSYDYEQFLSSFNYIELVRNKEKLWSSINLSKLKSILTSAEKNSVVFETLGIDIFERNINLKIKKKV